jgi:hypothetical protein
MSEERRAMQRFAMKKGAGNRRLFEEVECCRVYVI